MNITFTYTDIISQVKMLTAFEGRDYVNGDGDSMFLSVVVTEQDEPLIITYINQALNALSTRFERMIDGITIADTHTTWSLRTTQTRHPKANGATLNKHLKEAIVSYTLMNWFAERKADRVAMYSDLFNGSAELAAKNLFSKAAPIRRKQNHQDIDEVTIKVV